MYSKAEKALINKYRDYYGEDWCMVDCKAMTWPFYKLNVSYRYSEEESLPLIEEFVLKAIDTGYIQDMKSLSLFLGLEQDILDTVIADLHQKSVLALSPCLSLLEKGKALLSKQRRRVTKEEKIALYMDGVSGKCRKEDVRSSSKRGAAVKPAIIFPRKETLEAHYRTLFEFLSHDLEKQESKKKEDNINHKGNEKKIKLEEVLEIHGNAKRLYVDSRVLFYQDTGDSSSGRVIVLMNGELDEDATNALEGALAEGKSGLDIKEQRKGEYQDTSVNQQAPRVKISTTSDIEKCSETIVIEMLDHPVLLQAALTTATNQVIINSPWISSGVVDSEFKHNLEDALKRGVMVKFFYGMKTSGQRQQRRKPDIDEKTEKYFEGLSKRYRGNFHLIKQEANHAKVLICDERFMVVTSYNWLSFPGHKNGMRIETGTLIKNKKEIQNKVEQLLQNQ